MLVVDGFAARTVAGCLAVMCSLTTASIRCPARRGTPRRPSGETRQAAETELRKLERQVRAGRVPWGTTARTFGEQLDRWHAAKDPRLSVGSQSAYRVAVKLLAPLRGIPLGKVSPRTWTRCT